MHVYTYIPNYTAASYPSSSMLTVICCMSIIKLVMGSVVRLMKKSALPITTNQY